MDPRYTTVVANQDEGVDLRCEQCKTTIFENNPSRDENITLFELVRTSLRHQCEEVEAVAEIVRQAME